MRLTHLGTWIDKTNSSFWTVWGSRELGDRRDRSIMASTIGSFPTECKQKNAGFKKLLKTNKKNPSVNLTNWRMVRESHHECIDVICQPTMGSLPKGNVALESFTIYLDTRNLSKQIWMGPQKAETYVYMYIYIYIHMYTYKSYYVYVYIFES